MRAIACLALLALCGCFTELTDQACETQADCFDGELCSGSGLCVGVVSIGADTGDDEGSISVTFEVSGTDAPAFVRVAQTDTCSCQAPCTVEGLEAGMVYPVCVESRGSAPCRVAESFVRDTTVTLHLTKCEGCDDRLPDGCVCPPALPECE